MFVIPRSVLVYRWSLATSGRAAKEIPPYPAQFLKTLRDCRFSILLAWSYDPVNPTGTEYIIQEHVEGTQLHELWPQMNSLQHMQSGEAELYRQPSLNKGPWKNLEDYTSGLIEVAFSRLPSKRDTNINYPPFQGSIEDHENLLKICQETMQRLHQDNRIQEASLPAFSLIDWQLTCIEPAFIYARTNPDFATFPEMDPSKEGEEEKPLTKTEERFLKDVAICYQTYDVVMKGLTPKLRLERELDASLFRLHHYCYNTWHNGIASIRQDLIDLKALWSELGLEGECPYSPNQEELEEHAKQFEDFKTKEELKSWLRVCMQTTSDGWVPNELWDTAKEFNREAYKKWIETAQEAEASSDGDTTVEKAERLWPFDAR
ncbi:hypothetical protein FQN57_001618 [Myotisia sp. PD_48]|nr:hypothetical protein FQN57_001618 [Myotisia sp. PD_48]